MMSQRNLKYEKNIPYEGKMFEGGREDAYMLLAVGELPAIIFQMR